MSRSVQEPMKKRAKATVDASKKLYAKAVKRLHKSPPESSLPPCVDFVTAQELCNYIAWIGALVVTAVVLRSLYLMYLKPDG